MDIVERIQNEYPLNYFVMDNGPAASVELRFSEDVPIQLQTRLTEVLHDRFALTIAEGADLCLTVQREQTPNKKTACYRLLQDEQILFRFPEALPLTYRDHVEAMAWVIYALCTDATEVWLEKLRGGVISCRILCAQQQKIAADYRTFAQNQYNGGRYTDKHYSQQCQALVKHCQKFVNEAPLPSGLPICKEGFALLKKSVLGIRTGKTLPAETLFQKLFGDVDFAQILELYCQHIKTTETYRLRLEQAKKLLTEAVRKVPIAAANAYLSGLSHYISNLTAQVPGTIQCDPICIARDSKALRNALAPFDEAWRTYAKHRIFKEFLHLVQRSVDAQMDEELKKANHVIQDARIALNQFSVLNNGNGDRLNWQYLSQPETANVYTPETEWDSESFSALQRMLSDNEVWLCSQKLLEVMQRSNQFAQGMDRTYGAQLSNDQYIWAFWRTNP